MSVISEGDYQTFVREFNATDEADFLGKRLDKLFETIVDKYPSNIALVHDETQVTYHELNKSANLFARCLANHGVRHGDLVGLAVGRSVDLVVAMLSVLKLGAAYVPIDFAFPEERISQMIEDAEPKLILTNSSSKRGPLRWKDLCLSVEEVRRSSSITDTSNLKVDIQVQDLAYIIYTSGSTGRPKGVEISHGAASNFLTSLWRREPGCGPHDRLLAITTISFDMSALELLLPPLSGATMIIAHTNAVKDPRELVRLMKHHAVTIMQATPATWTMLLESGWKGEPRLSKIICGGEALTRRLADRILAYADSVWNVYGPSETTYGSVGRVSDEGDIYVGNPIANGRIYVLDENMLPVPMGCSGEVYIGGGSVSNGYRNKPELTQSRFLENPFHGGTFFRTGDMARFAGPGNLQVLGRIDGMVKIRGFRIEVGDIEAAIVSNDAVSEAVVINREDRLVAYCVPSAASTSTSTSTEARGALLDSTLRPWLASRLPEYMVPAFFVMMDALPLSPNQKVDRRALPDPVMLIEATSNMLQPTTDMERLVKETWANILGHDRIGIDDSFFQIGGDSVRLIRMQSQLEKLLNRQISVPTLFEHFTIRALAAHLVGVQNSANSNKPPRREHRGASGYDDDIAVISMGCRLPGGVTNPDEFWDLLYCGVDAIVDVPKDRWDAGGLYDADPDATGKSYCRQGGFISHSYDTSFFGISPRESEAMDPTQHLTLEVGWETFERAGYTKETLRASETGVFMGVSNNVTTTQAAANLDGYSITGSASAVLAGRLSYILGLHGPSMTVDTACSSSLVSTHLACNALRLGECDLALAGGISLLTTPGIHIEFSRLRGLSPDGRCRAFSADTQGTGFSEGCSMILLKRLADAQRDGDTIHAVLRGSAVSHGGCAASLTAPSGPSQAKLIRKVLDNSALQACDIDYIEAHGTATRLGDPIEAGALADVFSGSHPDETQPLWVGSSKSNIGHTGAAAGVTGMIKVILSLQHGLIPRTLHVTEPTAAVDWKGAGMALVIEEQPWIPRGNRVRRAGISALGIAGTGAHVVLEEPPNQVPKSDQGTPSLSSMMFLVSGQTDTALQQQVSNLRRYLSSCGEEVRLGDVAYSLAVTRNHFQRRLVLEAKDKEHLLLQLTSSSQVQALPPSHTIGTARLAFLFSGQGSQILGASKTLYQSFPQFRTSLDEVVTHFSYLDKLLLDVMWADAGSELALLLDRTDYAQPALFALQVALWQLWRSWGVQPGAVLGHSLGEVAAAYASGILDLPNACKFVAARSKLMQALPTGNGVMVVLEADAADVAMAIKLYGLDDLASIAAHNTPVQTVVSADDESASKLAVHFTSRGRKAKRLNVSHAFHSRYMHGMLAEFRLVLEKLVFHRPKIAVVSGRTGKLTEPGQLEHPEYWVQQVVDAVRFRDGVKTLADLGFKVFVELGSQPILSAMGLECFAEDRDMNSAAWLPSLSPGKDEVSLIQRSLSELHIRHVAVDWPAYFKPFYCRRVQLPTYSFQRTERLQEAKVTSQVFTPKKTTRQADRHRFEITWRPISVRTEIVGTTWGILCIPGEEVPWASQVTASLARAGIKLQQCKQLSEANGLAGLLCLWDSAAGVLDQAHGMTAKALTQLQSAAAIGFSPALVWVTRQAVGTGHENESNAAMRIGAAPLWGLLRVARTEHPELRLRLVDLGEGQDAFDPLIHSLVLEGEPECALRNGQVFVPRLQRFEPHRQGQVQQQQFVRQDGAVLLTGGLGDIGQQVARHLVRAHGVIDLVLTCRRGMDAPGAQALVDELTQFGARVSVIAADMGNQHSVEALMSLFDPLDRPLRGIVHTAGILDDGVLSLLTPQKLKTVFHPKVDGAWHLHQFTQSLGLDLDFFIMCSSISGIIGNAGQANYAAANTFLDALSHMRRAAHLPATSVSLGLWGGQGMRARLSDADQARYAEMGMNALELEDGLDLFEQLALDGHPHTIAAAYNLDRLRVHYEESGGIPVLFQSLLGRELPLPDSDAHSNLRRLLSGADRMHKDTFMLNMVQKEVAKILGFASQTSVNVDQPLQEIGIDSLTAVLTRNRLGFLTGLTLPAKIVFEHPNVRALSQFLLLQVQESLAMASSSGTSSHRTSFSEGPSSGASSCVTSASGSMSPSKPLERLDWSVVNTGCLDRALNFKTFSAAAPKAVFITGATGFVGAFIAAHLLKLGISIHCLIRATSVDHARERLIETLTKYDLWTSEYEPLLTTIVGDAALPFFGISDEAFHRLADQVDAVCHSAALVDWMRPLEHYIGPNVTSTQEVLRLVSCGRPKVLHHISTIAVLPRYLGHAVSEDEVEYGYATSKWMAEQMVASARWRGAKAHVYRLPYVCAASTGQFRLDGGDFLHNLVAGCVDIGSFPSIETDLSLVLPVDYLASSVVAVMMMTREDLLHRTGQQDFTFGNSINALTFDQYFTLLASEGQRILPFCEWRHQALDYAAAHPTSPLARIAAVLDGCYSEEEAASLFKCPAVGIDVLACKDFPVPLIDRQSVQRYLGRIGQENKYRKPHRTLEMPVELM
uniref:SwnK-like protein 2 n=1 Tax=Slafractonia leguminicola TaxID=1541393 RepID=A0A2Z2EXF8_9PEZI|nr:SwnK-like protein 2 [Slafractonia leguminicola]